MTENKTTNAKTFAERAAAEPTDLHKQFAAWIAEKTGVTPDLKTVQLAVTLRMDFQRSEDNQEALVARKAKAADEKKAAAAKRLAKLEAELAKLKGETVEEAAPAAPAEVAEPVAPEAPAEAQEAAPEPAATPAKPVRRRRTATTK